MRLVWARYALDDRDTIFSYIERENPGAAVHVDEEIVSAVRRMLDFPEICLIFRKAAARPGCRNSRACYPSDPYIAAYMVMADRNRILRVLHGAQKWPSELDDEYKQPH